MEVSDSTRESLAVSWSTEQRKEYVACFKEGNTVGVLRTFFENNPYCVEHINSIFFEVIQERYSKDLQPRHYRVHLYFSPLSFACTYTEHSVSEFIDYLLELGADPAFPPDRTYSTPPVGKVGLTYTIINSPIHAACRSRNELTFIRLHKLGQRPPKHAIPDMVKPLHAPYIYEDAYTAQYYELEYPHRNATYLIYNYLMQYDAEWFWSMEFSPDLPNWLFFVYEYTSTHSDLLFGTCLCNFHPRMLHERNANGLTIVQYILERTAKTQEMKSLTCLYMLYIQPDFPHLRGDFLYMLRYASDTHVEDYQVIFADVYKDYQPFTLRLLLDHWDADKRIFTDAILNVEVVLAARQTRVGAKSPLSRIPEPLIRTLQKFLLGEDTSLMLRFLFRQYDHSIRGEMYEGMASDLLSL